MDYPHNEVFQCSNTHLMCGSCISSVEVSQRPLCPICRVKLTDTRCRNRIAEELIGQITVQCFINGCESEFKMKERGAHEKACQFSKVKCRFSQIGCEWVGVRKDQGGHEKTCSMSRMKGSALTKLLNDKVHKERQAGRVSVVEDFTNILTSPCKEVRVLDINLKKGPNGVQARFGTMNLEWIIAVEKSKNPQGALVPNEIAISLQRCGVANGPSKLSWMIMRGPVGESMTFNPVMCNGTSKYTTGLMKVVTVRTVVDEDSYQLLGMVGSLNVRFIIADQSTHQYRQNGCLMSYEDDSDEEEPSDDESLGMV